MVQSPLLRPVSFVDSRPPWRRSFKNGLLPPHGAAFLLNHIMNCSGNEVIAKKVKILPAAGKLKEETYTHVANRLIYMHLSERL